MACFTVATRIDNLTYKKFAYFNNYKAFHRWIGYLVFFVLMLLCAIVNLKTGGFALFVIFLVLTLLAALWNVVLYKPILQKQTEKLSLDKDKIVYTLQFSEDGFKIANGKEAAAYKWNQVYVAYKVTEGIYLYMLKTRCFIIPSKDIQNNKTADDLWKFLQSHLQKHQVKAG